MKFSEEGHNMRSKEEQAWVHCIIEGCTGCTISDVLVFFSGADQVPPLGFIPSPKVSFLHSPTSKFSTASTCDICLRLPTCRTTRHSRKPWFHRSRITMVLVVFSSIVFSLISAVQCSYVVAKHRSFMVV